MFDKDVISSNDELATTDFNGLSNLETGVPLAMTLPLVRPSSPGDGGQLKLSLSVTKDSLSSSVQARNNAEAVRSQRQREQESNVSKVIEDMTRFIDDGGHTPAGE